VEEPRREVGPHTLLDVVRSEGKATVVPDPGRPRSPLREERLERQPLRGRGDLLETLDGRVTAPAELSRDAAVRHPAVAFGPKASLFALRVAKEDVRTEVRRRDRYRRETGGLGLSAQGGSSACALAVASLESTGPPI